MASDATMVLIQRSDCNTALGTPEDPPVNLMAAVSPGSGLQREGDWPAYSRASASVWNSRLSSLQMRRPWYDTSSASYAASCNTISGEAVASWRAMSCSTTVGVSGTSTPPQA
ncbi:hypothetical protein D9M72_146470 [compost metagenome]